MRKKLNVIIDRPIGYEHPDWPGFIYLVNYGYVPGVMAPDSEEQDVFVLGVDTPLQTFKGELIAIIHRRDDIEDKWVAVPEGMSFTVQEIEDAVAFSEQYFDSYIEMV